MGLKCKKKNLLKSRLVAFFVRIVTFPVGDPEWKVITRRRRIFLLIFQLSQISDPNIKLDSNERLQACSIYIFQGTSSKFDLKKFLVPV